MKRSKNEDGTTSYTLSDTEKMLIGVAVAYLFGRRTGFYAGRRSMAIEIEKTKTT